MWPIDDVDPYFVNTQNSLNCGSVGLIILHIISSELFIKQWCRSYRDVTAAPTQNLGKF